jgi:hypothetical protein
MSFWRAILRNSGGTGAAIALALAVSAFVSAGAFARERKAPPPNPQGWFAKAFAGKEDFDLSGFPHRLVFVTSLPVAGGTEAPGFLALDFAAFNRLGFFQAVDTTSAAWDYKLNPQFAEQDALTVIMGLVDADTVVVASADGPWQLVRPAGKRKREVLASVDGPGDAKAESIYEWLPTALGWDGVVLAQRGEHLLVASSRKLLDTPEVQALAVEDSADKFALPEDRKGTGLLSLSRADGGIGVFDIVFLAQGITTLAPGTKLLIERKE